MLVDGVVWDTFAYFVRFRFCLLWVCLLVFTNLWFGFDGLVLCWFTLTVVWGFVLDCC